MLEQAERISELLKKHIAGAVLSEQEQTELDEWKNQSPENKALFNRVANEDSLNGLMVEYYTKSNTADERAEAGLRYATQGSVVNMAGATRSKKRNFLRWIAAASVIIFIVSAYFLFFSTSSPNGDLPSQSSLKPGDTPPGQYKAKLTLSDGSIIILDSAGTGLLARQGNTQIINDDGSVRYDPKERDTEVAYNTLTTATGESYSIILSDGTKVWLNAQSSLRFPVNFTDGERKVELSGEAYFEVTQSVSANRDGGSGKQSFIVSVMQSSKQACEVEVLGTHFNINAYTDEATIKTTLLEGAVAVKKENAKQLIAPGQQAVMDDNAGRTKVISSVNVESVVAWKDQTFDFDRDDLPTIMRQLSRWYGISVTYEGKIPGNTYTGMISRNTNLSEVLQMLQQLQINFRMEENKKLVVMP